MNEDRNKDMVHQLEMKERKESNMKAKLERQDEEMRQMKHELEQTKISCDNILQQHDKNDEEKYSKSKGDTYTGKIKELETTVETLMEKNDRSIKEHKHEMQKLNMELDNTKGKYRKKDSELIEKTKLVENLCLKLQQSDEKYLEFERKISCLEESIESSKLAHGDEVSHLTTKISDITRENKKLTKLLQDPVQHKDERAAGKPANKSAVTPLAKSLSNLKVLSHDDDPSNKIMTEDENVKKSVNETSCGKRDSDSVPDKSERSKKLPRRSTVNLVEEKENVIPSSKTQLPERRKSSRISKTKPYSKEKSSSDEEVVPKIVESKEEEAHATVEPVMSNRVSTRRTRSSSKLVDGADLTILPNKRVLKDNNDMSEDDKCNMQ